MLESVRQLYIAFDKVFSRPKSLYNARCCVSKDNERQLLALPREQLTEWMLSMPMDHSDGCFATFDEISYYVPRLMELFVDSENGFEAGNLNISFFRFLRDHQDDYQRLGLWEPIEQAMMDVFHIRTSVFPLRHFDQEACAAKGWGIIYDDIMAYTEFMDELLGEFLFPILSKRSIGRDDLSEYDVFFERWAADSNPYRIAHLLEITKRYFEDRIFSGYAEIVPCSYIRKLEQVEFKDSLIERVKPILSKIKSPTWFRDVCAWLGYGTDDKDSE